LSRWVEARRYVAPLREGGSLPAIVDAEPPGQYVVKFRGAGQGPKALIAEAIAAGLAEALGLPIPAPAIVTLDAGFGRGEPDPEIQDILRGSVGANFGLTYLPGALGFDSAADLSCVAPDMAAEIVWFDAFLTNPDRTLRNPNLLIWEERVWLIDHGASLYFHHRWEGSERKARAEFPLIREHILLPRAGDLATANARLIGRLDESIILRVVSDVPEEWIVLEAPFATIEAQREAYVNYLRERLCEPRVWLPKASDVRRSA
jgi:hypothetical protein